MSTEAFNSPLSNTKSLNLFSDIGKFDKVKLTLFILNLLCSKFTDSFIGCPRQYKCLHNPNSKEPSIDDVLDSLRQQMKK